MLDYNKTRLLLDFELPSGNLFDGPITLLNVPRCGEAPAQGFILTDQPIPFTATQRTELIAKYVDAGYTSDRATAFADSFSSPSFMQVGIWEGQKAISIARSESEASVTPSNVAHLDDKWVMYEALELAQLFDLTAYVTNDSVLSIVDHPKITGKGWELFSPALIPGLPNDSFDTTLSNLFATTGGHPWHINGDTPRAWFAANAREYVYCAVPVGKRQGSYVQDAIVILRRRRTVHDRNVVLAYFKPESVARSSLTIESMVYGYSGASLIQHCSGRGHPIGAHGRTDAFTFQALAVSTYSPKAIEVQEDWPNMLKPVTNYAQADADNFISRKLYVYGWLDAPRSSNWSYDDIAITADGDVTVITVNPVSTLQNFAEGQLRRFMDQLILNGSYTGDDLTKLTESRDSLADTWETGIHAMSRRVPYTLSANIEETLPVAVKVEESGEDPREMELTAAPVVTLGFVADKARSMGILKSLCFMPKDDQVSGLFGAEVITFTGVDDGVGGVNLSFTMTQFGQPYEGTTEDMMVATSLGAQWVLVGCTESQVASFYFNGAVNRAGANSWIDAEDKAVYHSPEYRLDDFHCFTEWSGWPADVGAKLAKLTVNQLIGDRATTARLLFAMSAWSVGRRLRHTYTTFEAFLTGETEKLSTKVFNPTKGWYDQNVTGLNFLNNGFDVVFPAGERMANGEVVNGSALKVCFDIIVVNKVGDERLGVANFATPGTHAFRIDSGGTPNPALVEGAAPPAPTNGARYTFALDKSVPGAARLRLYRNGTYHCGWAVSDSASFYPAQFGGGNGARYRLDIRPAVRPVGYDVWDASLAV